MKPIVYIFVFFCFFPYIDIINIGTDTQPNALVMSALLLFAINNKRLNLPIILLWVLFLFSLFRAVTSSLSVFETLKNILNYLSAPMICLAAYNVFIKMKFRLSFRLFMFVVLSYFTVGFMQMFVDPEFMTFLLNQGARGVMLGGRGVVSLCPEPAFYGSICLFFIVFSLLQYSGRQNLYSIPLLVIQLVFFSQSATSIIILLAGLLVFMVLQLLRFRMSYVLASVMVLILFTGFRGTLQDSYTDSRASILINEIIENPLLIAQIDVSAGVRITSSISPFLAMKHNAFMPMGMGRYKDFVSDLYKEGHYPKLLSVYIVNEIGRLGGGINMILFHLGFIGLLFPMAIYMCFKKNLRNDKVLLAFVIFIVLLFTQIQLMHSMIGFILASALFLGKEKMQQSQSYA